jgi:putative transposase
MPRKPRFNLPGLPQHIIQRGNNRQACFFSEPDYRQYLEDLATAADYYQCQVHAYVMMTNHVHLLVTPLIADGVSQMMQSLGRRYVYYVNHLYGRTGTLWEGRYKSCLIDSDRYLLACMRYIELNPVRADIVEHPGDYKWSSYHTNAFKNVDELITCHPVYTALGSNSTKRELAYRDLFLQHIDRDTVRQIRESLNHELVFGRAYFKDKIEQMTRRQTRLGQPGRPFVGK